MTVHITRALCLMIVAGVLTACTATATGSDQQREHQPPILLTAEQIMAEYLSETEQLELAPGDTWDSNPVQLSAAGAGGIRSMMYEPGVGAQTAQLQWYCSWATAALFDDDLRATALAKLAEFPSLSVWQYMDYNGHLLYERISAGAARGDLGALAEYVDNNCAPRADVTD